MRARLFDSLREGGAGRAGGACLREIERERARERARESEYGNDNHCTIGCYQQHSSIFVVIFVARF